MKGHKIEKKPLETQDKKKVKNTCLPQELMDSSSAPVVVAAAAVADDDERHDRQRMKDMKKTRKKKRKPLEETKASSWKQR